MADEGAHITANAEPTLDERDLCALVAPRDRSRRSVVSREAQRWICCTSFTDAYVPVVKMYVIRDLAGRTARDHLLDHESAT